MPKASDVCPFRCCYEDTPVIDRNHLSRRQAEFSLAEGVPLHVRHLTADIPDLIHLFNTIRKHVLGIAAWPAAKSAEQVSEDLNQLVHLFGVLQYLLMSFSAESDDGHAQVECTADQLTDLVAHVVSQYETVADMTPEQAARELQPAYVHACLHVHWGAVHTLHVLSALWPGKRIFARRVLLLLPDRTSVDVARLPAFEQHALLALWNLVVLARLPFSRVARSHAYGDASPFTCCCVRDLWARLIVLLENSHSVTFDGQRFWPMLDQLCDPLIHGVADVPQQPPIGPLDSRTVVLPMAATKRQTGAGFYLWLLRHLAPVCLTGTHGGGSNSATGQPCKRPSANSPQVVKNFAVLRKILEELLKQVPDDAACASYMECTLALHRLWGVESDFGTLHVLWNHFIRHLNTYAVPKTSAESSSMAYGFSPAELLRNCRSVAEERSGSCHQGRTRETSWAMFLRILCLNMQAASSSGEWKKLFARLLVRLNIRTIQNLTEVGLYNFVKLCLVMSLTGDVQVSSARMVDLLSHVEPSSTSPEIGVAIWSGTCAASILCLERGCNIATLADVLGPWLHHYCCELRQAGTAAAYAEAWAPLPSLLTAFEELLTCADDLDMAQCRVLQAESLASLLQGCRRAAELGAGGEADRVLRFLSVVLARVRLHHRSRCCNQQQATVSTTAVGLVAPPGADLAALQGHLWKHAYPYLVDFVACDHEALSDVAADHVVTGENASPGAVAAAALGFTYLAALCKDERQGGRELAAVFADFSRWCPDRGAVHGSTAGEAVLLYISHVLTDAPLVAQLQQCRFANGGAQAFPSRVMSTWMMACAELPSDNGSGIVPVLDDLFREIRCQTWFLALWQLDPCAADGLSRTYSGSLLGLLGAAAEANASGGVKARTALRDTVRELLRDLPAAVTRAVSDGTRSGKQMESVYYFCAHLVQLCAPLIYAKGQVGCLLTAILDRLVLPRVLFSSKKALPPARLALMKDYLPHFLSGLASLDYRKDAYVGRKTRDIVWNYLLKFAPSKADDWSCHPLLAVLQPTLLSEAASAPVTDDTAIRICIVESIAMYISDCDPCDYYADEAKATGLKFLTELLSRTKNGKYLLRDAAVLLELLLQCCAFSSDSQLASCSLDVLRTLLKCLRERVDEPTLLSSDLPALLKGYLASALTDASKAAAVFGVLHKVSSFCVPLVASAAGVCVSAVEKFEAGRPNTGLRRQCKLLLQSLGSRSAEERFDAGMGTGL